MRVSRGRKRGRVRALHLRASHLVAVAAGATKTGKKRLLLPLVTDMARVAAAAKAVDETMNAYRS